MKALFLFQRNLRIPDNLALKAALENPDIDDLVLLFIFDPVQISKQNKYISYAAIHFMIQSLQDLDKYLSKYSKNCRVIYYNDSIEKSLTDIHKVWPFDYVYLARDYTPFAKSRLEIIKNTIPDIKVFEIDDICLLPVGTVLTGNQTVYKVFTPFYRKCQQFSIEEPVKITKKSLESLVTTPQKIKNLPNCVELEDILETIPVIDNIIVQGGRTKAKKILKKMIEFKHYDQTRNFPDQNTTLLSAYNKFGCVSIREVYYAIKEQIPKQTTLIQQLFWRDFYYGIANYFPEVFKTSFDPKFNNFPWEKNREWFENWKEGTTGFPIVDAGMRQLNSIHWMHNRLRMIVASFLTKDLIINWQDGERYFANQLVDYDPSQNNGGWQWSAGTGTDAQPFFRIMNPWTQGKKFDPDCVYIKEWIPELKDVPSGDIHNWFKRYNEFPNVNYPKPIVEHDVQRKKALDLLKKYA